MKWAYLTAGLLSLLVSLAATAPARYVYAWSGAGRMPLHAAGISGSVWHGHADAISSGAFRLSNVQWRLHAPGLLGARLQFMVTGDTPGGHADALVQLGAGSGDIEFHDLRLATPLADMTAAAGFAGLPLSGQISARLEHVAIVDEHLKAAAGTIALGEVSWLLGNPALPLGAFEATIDTAPDGTIRAQLRSQPGNALVLRGTATLSAAGLWRIDVDLRPASDAGARIAGLLAALGKPDQDGWRHVRENGSL